MTSYNIIEGPDIDEEGVQVQDQEDNEVEIIDGKLNSFIHGITHQCFVIQFTLL